MKENTRKYNSYLYDLILELKLSPQSFAKSLGFSRTDRIYNVLKGINGISNELAKIITEKYTNVDYNWLLTGEGEMFVNNTNIEEYESKSISNSKYQIVENIEDIPKQFRNWVKPFYPDMKVGAGLELGNYNAPTKYFILVPFSEKVQFWVPVEGKSMLPRYNNNDLIGLSEIHYDGVFPGHNYVVALKSGSAHLKRVEFIKEKPDTLSLVSLNPEYDPKEFYIDKIDKFFKVKMFISNDE
ncbi:S24 family peptidase [Elizabethkingia anophelis]|uniref:S24 family peptidase n=1 Tax=Elizabethkingia anophelis TaxID=1117645 RepID=UPI00201211F5|nr:S24 family peptidase [Elizabethkingia anophelis]MCL1691960.1 hypothetical protein [Elizabethkingia anophelis]